jgi:outer membrane protein insertion porin family
MYYDSTNHPVLPKKGARSTLEGEYAGIGGDHHFFVLGYLNSMYFSPDGVGVFKIRADAQAIQTVLGTKPSSLPLDERLYLGGENTMRGYRFNMVGPHFGDTHHTPRGGMSSLLFSGEYERPLYKKFNGFLFTDAGNVWWKEFHYGNLKYSYGFGFRFYISDTTPITFGFGFPLTHSSKRDVQRFFFSIGVGF